MSVIRKRITTSGADELPLSEPPTEKGYQTAKRLSRIEEGQNTPECIADTKRREELERRQRLYSWRNIGLVASILLFLACTSYTRHRIRLWERNLKDSCYEKHEVCQVGIVLGKPVHVLAFSDPELPTMYGPRYNKTTLFLNNTKMLRSMEQSAQCPNKTSVLRYEHVDATYKTGPWGRRRAMRVTGTAAACLQHYQDAWNGTCP